jgi:hypothetical protein
MVFALSATPNATAHDTAGPDAAAPAAVREDATALIATVDPEAPVAAPIQVALGAHVHLTVLGAGPGALHLHGYDLTASIAEGQPAIFVFDATHAGRFPLMGHVTDPLLGSRERAVLYIEVRAP